MELPSRPVTPLRWSRNPHSRSRHPPILKRFSSTSLNSMNFKSFIRLSFIPSSSDCGLLALRVWLGLSMLLIHGIAKLQNFGATVDAFTKMGFPKPLAVAAIVSEGVMTALLVVGFATRWAAAFLATTMAVAFVHVHKAVLA